MNSTFSTTIRNSSNIKIDKELQEKLHSNIALLNMVHPPSIEFMTVFKKDMFSRSNKAAFFHVTHYLIHVLNPEMAKTKLITWPTLNIVARENKFRNELHQCLNELNNLYEDANLPVMLSSHLLAPGGYRFINYMYKLSQLVMFEVLKNEYPNEILHKPKPTKNESMNEILLENMGQNNIQINTNTNILIEKFEKTLKFFKEEANKITEEKNSINNDLKKIQDNLDEERQKLNANKLRDDEILNRINSLRDKSKVVDKINEVFAECETLLNHLKDGNDKGEILNMFDSVKNLNSSLKKQLNELPTYAVLELEYFQKEVDEKRADLENFERSLRNNHETLIESMKNSKIILSNIIDDLEED